METDSVEVTVIPSTQPAISQSPTPMCLEFGQVELDAGAGYLTYEWKDDTDTVVGSSRLLSLDALACGRTYTATMTDASTCLPTDSHLVECITCVPPEVSAPGTSVPLRMGLDAAGTIEFELLPEPDIMYQLYSAPSMAAILAGDWSYKFCDLETGAFGTWTPISGDTVQWTPNVPGLIFEGYWVVVAKRFGLEGPYGSGRPPDADELGSVISFCP